MLLTSALLVYIISAFLKCSSAIQPCSEIDSTLTIPCQCQKKEFKSISVDCDYVVFKDDFPLLPFKMKIVEFKQRFSNLQDLTSQLFTASQVPLKKLDFSHNEIRKLNGRVFDGLEGVLETLFLQHNKFGDVYTQRLSLPEVSRLVKLKSLNLGFNEIQSLDEALLRNLNQLQVLQLDGNFLQNVPTQELKGLDELKVLTLQENDLSSIEEGAFHTTANLVFLNLSNNEIEIVQNRAFYQLKNLTTLDLSHNRLERLEPEAFQGLLNLEELDLSSNFFNEIPADAFKELSVLKKLYMQGNRIQTLGGIVAFGPASTLTYLDLTRNSIVNLESRTFKRLVQLKTLKLSVNSFGKRKSDAFDGLNSLEKLELDDHRFFSFPSNMLALTPSLKSLSLNFNRIRVLTNETLQTVRQLETFSIANNIIQEIIEGTFKHFTQLKTLNLNGNKITSIYENSFEGISEMILELNIGDNSLTELPILKLPNLSKFTISGNQITSLPENSFFYFPQLQFLDMSRNKITTLSVNLFDSLSRLGTLNLSFNKLNKIQSGLFNGTVLNVINLSKNKIREVEHKAFENLLLLTSLDISDNKIEVIQDGALHDASFLHILNVKNNKLTSFNKNIFSFTKTNESQMRYLDLSGNQITFIKDDILTPHPRVIWLSLSRNRLSFFPVNALKNAQNINQIDLSENEFESISNADFANIKTLRELNLRKNRITEIAENTFQNSTQLQELNLSENKIKTLPSAVFEGIAQLKLDLSKNQLSYLPDDLFQRSKLRLLSLNIAHNDFSEVPVKALRSQYSFFNELNMAFNNISKIPDNANILVNMKSLDLSYNPLSSDDILELLNEPKLLRKINLAGANIKEVPLIEARFLTELNLSNNAIKEATDKSFKLTHNLRTLDLSNNRITNFDSGISAAWPELPNLRYLDISSNPIKTITKDGLNSLRHLKVFRGHDLPQLTSVDSLSFININLRELYLYKIPNVNTMDIEAILETASGLEKLDVELTHSMIDAELREAFSPRLEKLTIRGSQVKQIKSSGFLYLNSPNVELGIIDTSVSSLDERMLFLVPMSSNIKLYVNNSRIETLSENFLDDVAIPRKDKLMIFGLDSNPIYCDCNLHRLREWVIDNEQNHLKNLTCQGPTILKGKKIVSLSKSQLICSDRKKEMNDLNIIITKDEIDEQIVKQKGSGKELKQGQMHFTGMDKIIIGSVGGVIGFVALLILIVCVFKLTCDRRARNQHPFHVHGNCTCVKPPIPGGFNGPYTIPSQMSSRAGTMKSIPTVSPIPPPYGTLGSRSRGSYYGGTPGHLAMYYQEEQDYR